MIPLGPLVGIAVWAALRNREGGGTARGPAPDGPAASLAQRPVPSWFWAHCGYAVVAAIALTQLGAWAAPPFVVLYAPWLLALGAARLGLVRPARLLGDLALFAFRKDPAGAPGFAGALALARRRVHDERWAARLVAGLDRLPVPVRGAALAARGLVAASRGHVEEARDLLGSVEHLDPRITPRPVRRIARDWLAADAAARGRWDEVERLARIAGPRSRAVRLLGLVARRLRGGGDAPGDLRLRLAWLLAPRRRTTRPLLRRALAAPLHRARATPPGAPPLASPLARAAALHLGVLAGPERVEARALRDLGRAWQEAIDDEGTAGALLARELALGADGRSDALRRVAERATDELSWLIERGRVPLRRVRGRGLIAAAGARVRDRLLGELQEEAERIHARALDPDQDVLTPAEEWRAIARLRERHAAAVAVLGAEGRRIAWEIVHPALSAVAVRLFNVRLERSIAHATFRFLAAEAEAVGDGENQGIHERNQLCGW